MTDATTSRSWLLTGRQYEADAAADTNTRICSSVGQATLGRRSSTAEYHGDNGMLGNTVPSVDRRRTLAPRRTRSPRRHPGRDP